MPGQTNPHRVGLLFTLSSAIGLTVSLIRFANACDWLINDPRTHKVASCWIFI